jgi:hypothetical protein
MRPGRIKYVVATKLRGEPPPATAATAPEAGAGWEYVGWVPAAGGGKRRVACGRSVKSVFAAAGSMKGLSVTLERIQSATRAASPAAGLSWTAWMFDGVAWIKITTSSEEATARWAIKGVANATVTCTAAPAANRATTKKTRDEKGKIQ